MMPTSMLSAILVFNYMAKWLESHKVSKAEAYQELDRAFPGFWEENGDMWLAQWIENNTT
jgi:hypothetical protein